MTDAWSCARRRFWVVNYLVLVALVLSIASSSLTGPAWLFTLAAAFGYGLVYLLPLMILVWLLKHLPKGQWLSSVVAVLGAAAMVILLYTDRVIFGMYGFHLNGFVWNLITTPGGIDSLESSTGTKMTIVGICVAIVVFEVLLFWALYRFASPQAGKAGWLKWALAAIFLCMLGERATFGVSHFKSYRSVLMASQQIPFYQQTTFSHFLVSLGEKPVRHSNMKMAQKGRLNYPLHPIQLEANAPKPNIIWLACESLRWDMLTPEIMPNLWAFAQKNWRYTNHYSGGNGTRWGIFTMFYGMPASYWFSFLDARQPPALINLLQKQGYQFGLYTSAEFTYPEFDKTVWAGLPSDLLHSNDKQVGWKDDRDNVTRLNHFVDGAQADDKPFLGFMFFESSHARYFFPDDAVIRPHYLKAFNYATVDVKKDIGLIKNRYINATHELDIQLGRVLAHLKEKGLLDNTIVIVTGDHGEEFMENGRWGHNSAFHNQQIHTPFVLHVPGEGARVVNAPTSHLDIVPTLMPLLGVTNPPADYSVDAHNLLKPTNDRYRVIGSWNALGYIGKDYKVSMPMNLAGAGYTAVTTADDKAVPNSGAVMAREKDNLAGLLKDISRFYVKH
ncbi:MAG: sulfatase-like hydrolase/transferase [Alcanivorax sp.]|nr:sulfatase-like hydrolase/transferase [Alcanivorax sp.]